MVRAARDPRSPGTRGASGPRLPQPFVKRGGVMLACNGTAPHLAHPPRMHSLARSTRRGCRVLLRDQRQHAGGRRAARAAALLRADRAGAARLVSLSLPSFQTQNCNGQGCRGERALCAAERSPWWRRRHGAGVVAGPRPRRQEWARRVLTRSLPAPHRATPRPPSGAPSVAGAFCSGSTRSITT
jgi:hypothetical protein